MLFAYQRIIGSSPQAIVWLMKAELMTGWAICKSLGRTSFTVLSLAENPMASSSCMNSVCLKKSIAPPRTSYSDMRSRIQSVTTLGCTSTSLTYVSNPLASHSSKGALIRGRSADAVHTHEWWSALQPSPSRNSRAAATKSCVLAKSIPNTHGFPRRSGTSRLAAFRLS